MVNVHLPCGVSWPMEASLRTVVTCIVYHAFIQSNLFLETREFFTSFNTFMFQITSLQSPVSQLTDDVYAHLKIIKR